MADELSVRWHPGLTDEDLRKIADGAITSDKLASHSTDTTWVSLTMTDNPLLDYGDFLPGESIVLDTSSTAMRLPDRATKVEGNILITSIHQGSFEAPRTIRIKAEAQLWEDGRFVGYLRGFESGERYGTKEALQRIREALGLTSNNDTPG